MQTAAQSKRSRQQQQQQQLAALLLLGLAKLPATMLRMLATLRLRQGLMS
jgi:hypothetical protein